MGFIYRYVAYCRKSTDEPDRQILSIEAQVAELKEFAERESLEIVEWVTESKTAKEPGRPQFNQVIQMIEDGKADGILSWHADRLARNSIDGGRIIYLLDTGKLLDLKFPSFWFENTPQGKFMLSIAFGQSKYYVDNLSENVKRGNRQKLRRGEWPNKAPFGYLNDLQTKTIVVDKKLAPIVAIAFKLFASGGYNYADIRSYFIKKKAFNKSGKFLHFDKVKRILADPFYYGLMKFNGELYEGKHQPLITKNLFDKCQLVVKQHTRKQKIVKHGFDYVGLIKCGECGASITAEKHHKHYQRTNRSVDYVYYRCSKKLGKCSQPYLDQSQTISQLIDLVGRASLTPLAAAKFKEWANRDANEEKQKSVNQINQLKLELHATHNKLDRLLEGYLDKVITSTEYTTKKNELMETKAKLTDQIRRLSTKGVEWLVPFMEFVNSALSAHQIARAKTQSHDLLIMAKTVGSNYFLKDQRLTAEYKMGGYAALSAMPGAGCAASSKISMQKLLKVKGSNVLDYIPPVGKCLCWLALCEGSPADFKRKLKFFIFQNEVRADIF